MAAFDGISFHHVGISVKSMDTAKAFYCDKLGFSVLWENQGRGGEPLSRVVAMPDVNVNICMLEGYGMRIELFQYLNPAGKDRGEQRQCDFGLIHIALKVPHIQPIYEALSAKGVRFNAPPQPMRPGVIATYMRDDEGNTIEIIENNAD